MRCTSVTIVHPFFFFGAVRAAASVRRPIAIMTGLMETFPSDCGSLDTAGMQITPIASKNQDKVGGGRTDFRTYLIRFCASGRRQEVLGAAGDSDRTRLCVHNSRSQRKWIRGQVAGGELKILGRAAPTASCPTRALPHPNSACALIPAANFRPRTTKAPARTPRRAGHPQSWLRRGGRQRRRDDHWGLSCTLEPRLPEPRPPWVSSLTLVFLLELGG